MALTAAYFAGGSAASTSNVAAFATTTTTFTTGNLYLVFVTFSDAEATAEVPSSVVLSGATPPTVTRVTGATATFDTVATPLRRLTCWWFIGDGVSRTITATMPDAGTGCIIYTVEVTGHYPSAPIVQGVGNQGDAAGGSTASATLASFADATDNGALVFTAIDANFALSAEAGGVWTEFNSGTDISSSTPANRVSGAFRIGQDTSPTMTMATASDWGCVALEIAVDITTTTVGVGTATETDITYPGDNGTERELFEGGTDGASIGNTDGIFDAGADTGSATWLYSDDHPIRGSLGGLATIPAGGTTYRRINFAASDEPLVFFRDYLWIPTVSISSTQPIIIALNSANANAGRLCLNTSEEFRLQNGSTNVGTAQTGIFDQHVRVEWKLDRANSLQTLRLFYGANIHGTTADIETTGTYDAQAGATQFRIGGTTANSNTEIYYHDAIAWSLTDWIGPSYPAGVGRRKTKALGTATETDTALAVTAPAGETVVAINFASETDTGIAVGRIKTKALGTATETDAGVALTRAKYRVLGVATETDSSPTPLTSDKTKALGVATETDAGVTLTRVKYRALGTATETDTAVAVAIINPILAVLGTATETDTAVAVAHQKLYDVAFATETDAVPTGETADEVEHFDTGVDGAAIGTTDLIFDAGVNGATSTVTYDNDRSISGTLSMKVHGVGTEITYRDVVVAGSDQALVHWREYIYIPTVNVTGANLTFLEARDNANTTRVCRIAIVASTEFMRMQNGTSGVGTGFDMSALYGQWVRLEWKMDRTNSQQTASLFYGANLHGTTPDQTETTTYNTGSGMARMRIGQVTAPDSPDVDQWRDALAWRLSDWVGPYGVGAVERIKYKALGVATETDTAVGVVSAGPTTVAVGTATETDTAVGVSRQKRRTLGVATETDAAVAVASRSVTALGVATETDTAVAVTSRSVTTINFATETDTAPATLGRRHSRALGVALEVDEAFAMPELGQMVVQVNPAPEADTALPLAARKVKALGFATETDTGQPVTITRKYPLGIAVEFDATYAITHSKTKALGTATETDTALAVVQSYPLGIPLETDTALPITTRKRRALGIANENDSGVPIKRRGTLGTALETDTGVTITRRKVKALGTATETETGVALGKRKTKLLAPLRANETDTARALTTRRKTKAVGFATETDTGRPIAVAKGGTLAPAAETDTALPLTGKRKTKALAFATETGTALGVTRVRSYPLGTATETDAARPLSITRIYGLGTAGETDEALPIAHVRRYLLGTALETDTVIHVVLRTHLDNITVTDAHGVDKHYGHAVLAGQSAGGRQGHNGYASAQGETARGVSKRHAEAIP